MTYKIALFLLAFSYIFSFAAETPTDSSELTGLLPRYEFTVPPASVIQNILQPEKGSRLYPARPSTHHFTYDNAKYTLLCSWEVPGLTKPFDFSELEKYAYYSETALLKPTAWEYVFDKMGYIVQRKLPQYFFKDNGTYQNHLISVYIHQINFIKREPGVIILIGTPCDNENFLLMRRDYKMSTSIDGSLFAINRIQKNDITYVFEKREGA